MTQRKKIPKTLNFTDSKFVQSAENSRVSGVTAKHNYLRMTLSLTMKLKAIMLPPGTSSYAEI